jgi:hypothetical protein
MTQVSATTVAMGRVWRLHVACALAVLVATETSGRQTRQLAGTQGDSGEGAPIWTSVRTLGRDRLLWHVDASSSADTSSCQSVTMLNRSSGASGRLVLW